MAADLIVGKWKVIDCDWDNYEKFLKIIGITDCNFESYLFYL